MPVVMKRSEATAQAYEIAKDIKKSVGDISPIGPLHIGKKKFLIAEIKTLLAIVQKL
jgi:hypothetical protein